MTRSDQPHNPIVITITARDLLVQSGSGNKINEPVAKTLQDFKDNGAVIILVTDGRETGTEFARKDVADGGFEKLIDVTITSTTFGLYKDNPKYWPRLANYLRIETKNIIHIDSDKNVKNNARENGVNVVSSNPKHHLVQKLTDTYKKLKHGPT